MSRLQVDRRERGTRGREGELRESDPCRAGAVTIKNWMVKGSLKVYLHTHSRHAALPLASSAPSTPFALLDPISPSNPTSGLYPGSSHSSPDSVVSRILSRPTTVLYDFEHVPVDLQPPLTADHALPLLPPPPSLHTYTPSQARRPLPQYPHIVRLTPRSLPSVFPPSNHCTESGLNLRTKGKQVSPVRRFINRQLAFPSRSPVLIARPSSPPFHPPRTPRPLPSPTSTQLSTTHNRAYIHHRQGGNHSSIESSMPDMTNEDGRWVWGVEDRRNVTVGTVGEILVSPATFLPLPHGPTPVHSPPLSLLIEAFSAVAPAHLWGLH
ncbi:hypothetical protein OF83DRAFT_1158988 [Amylostereum chailletii]|nr:hypothetical protein OF83DRAFT_1158988 [Amylostereum chailletii]